MELVLGLLLLHLIHLQHLDLNPQKFLIIQDIQLLDGLELVLVEQLIMFPLGHFKKLLFL
jgi:hypothetical protein